MVNHISGQGLQRDVYKAPGNRPRGRREGGLATVGGALAMQTSVTIVWTNIIYKPSALYVLSFITMSCEMTVFKS